MPLTAKGAKILAELKKNYGVKKGKEIFFKMQQSGKIKGTHK